jgi:hypothetical protein
MSDRDTGRVLEGSGLTMDGGSLEVQFRPEEGGRLAALRYRGVDLVVPPGRVPGFHGDTFWPSPQSLWDWPPPQVLDSAPYEVLDVTDHGLVVRSEPDPGLGLQVDKRFTVGEDRVSFEFTMTNTRDSAQAVAPWQVTRAPRDGLIVWAPGQAFEDDDRLRKQQEDPGCWFDHVLSTVPFEGYWHLDGHAGIRVREVTRTSKYFTDARGWAAHVHGGVALVRIFPDLLPGRMAPRQAELELFFGIERDYIELENQGAYELLGPGAQLVYATQWRVAAVPAHVPPDRVTPTLLDVIDDLLDKD